MRIAGKYGRTVPGIKSITSDRVFIKENSHSVHFHLLDPNQPEVCVLAVYQSCHVGRELPTLKERVLFGLAA